MMFASQGWDLRGDRGGSKDKQKKKPKKDKADKGIQRRESTLVSQGGRRPSSSSSTRPEGTSGDEK